MVSLETILRQHQHYANVLPEHLQQGPALVLDLSGNDQTWLDIDLTSVAAMQTYTQELMQRVGAVMAIGRYAENRTFLYQRSDLFTVNKQTPLNQTSLRSIHLGIDLTVPVGTPIYTPLMGTVYSVYNNKGLGDYGPTVILQHNLLTKSFYTLYGHLSKETLTHLSINQKVVEGQCIGWVGDSEVNGNWPPHLHFQIIENLFNNTYDFPGVIEEKKMQEYLENCPDPNLILRIAALQKLTKSF